MIKRLGADDYIVLETSDLSPLGGGCSGCLGQTTQITELSCIGDLGEGSTISLRYDGELSTVITDPAPRGAPLPYSGA